MKKLTITALLASAFAYVTPVYADPPVNEPPGCEASGEQPQKCGDNTATATGGTGIGIGIGTGGDASSTATATGGNAVATGGNAVAAGGTAIQGQQQGQLQGQQQGQSQSLNNSNTNANSNKNTNTNTNLSASVSSATGGSVTGSGNSTNTNTATGGSGGAGGSGQASSDNSVVVEGDNTDYHARRIPVATAYAPQMASGYDTCSMGTSIGGQSTLFGLSLGMTRHDKVCETLKLSRELKAQGFGYEACQLMVNEDPRVAAAFKSTGRFCTTATVEATAVVQPQQPVVNAVATQPSPVQPPFTGERGK